MATKYIKSIMSIRILFLFLFFSANFFAQNTTETGIYPFIHKKNIYDFELKKNENGTPYNGYDSLKNYFNGSDTINGVIHYINGLKSELKTFYLNGYQETHFKWKDSIRVHTQRWYKTGNLMIEVKYDLLTNEEISSIVYFENGNINFISDEKYKSISIGFYENGKIERYIKYILLPKVCPDSMAYENIEWYENGQLKSKRIFNCGKQPFKDYYNDTILGREGTLIGMLLFKVGKYSEWHPNGKIKLEAYYEDGNTQSEANIKTGIWKYYDENGNLLKEEEYKKNVLIRSKEFKKKSPIKN